MSRHTNMISVSWERAGVGASQDRIQPAMEDLVWIPGGTFLMGSDKHYPEEAPAHEVTVHGFWMDKYAVTNEEFRRFVEETRYVTLAERPPTAEDYPGAKPEWRLVNLVMQRRARWLLSRTDELFLTPEKQ